MNLHKRKLRVGLSATTDALFLACAVETESLTQSVRDGAGGGQNGAGKGERGEAPELALSSSKWLIPGSTGWIINKKVDNEIQVVIEKENLSANQDSSLATYVRGLLIPRKKGVVINIKTAL